MARIDHPNVREFWRLALIQGLQERGWNQREFRRALEHEGLKISQQAVSNWLATGVVPDAYAGLIACELLKMDLRWALTRQGSRSGVAADGDAVRIGKLEAASRMAAVLEEIRQETTGVSGRADRGLAAHLASERGSGKKRAQPGEGARRAGPR